MAKVIIYGLEFDTEMDCSPRKLKSNVAVATAKAFCAVRGTGRFMKSQLDILTNEVLRGRLDAKNKEAVLEMADTIQGLIEKGMDVKTIAILRSLYFPFEDIQRFADERISVDRILREEGIENPEIETIYGVTSRQLTEWYVSYDEAKGA